MITKTSFVRIQRTFITCNAITNTKKIATRMRNVHQSHDRCRSVNGTYITPIKRVCLMVPSLSLSNCSRYCSPPSGPTGQIRRPPGLSCLMSYKMCGAVVYSGYDYVEYVKYAFTSSGISGDAAPT